MNLDLSDSKKETSNHDSIQTIRISLDDSRSQSKREN